MKESLEKFISRFDPFNKDEISAIVEKTQIEISKRKNNR